jgi:hypothetical protein
MKIDYSKWVIKINDNDFTNIELINTETNEKTWQYFGNLDKKDIGEDPLKFIKLECKKRIKEMEVWGQLNRLRGKQIQVEDNLDYIENEAERRGLI